jgi:anti-anti-sigma factor
VSFRLRPPDDGISGEGRPYRRRRLVEGLPAGTAELVAVDGPDGLRLEIVGEVDLATVASIGEQLRARVDGLPADVALTLDFGRTTYLASAGVGLLLQVLGAARARGTATAVAAPEGSVPARLLRLSGLGDLLTGRSPSAEPGQDAPTTPLDPEVDRAVR